MPAQTAGKQVRLSKEHIDKLQRVMEHYGVTETGAIRLIIEKIDTSDLADGYAVREGIKAGQAAMMRSFAGIIAWLKVRGDKHGWDPVKMNADVEKLHAVLREWS